jgi:hypothetical protein
MASISGSIDVDIHLFMAPASPKTGADEARIAFERHFAGTGTAPAINLTHAAYETVTVPAAGNVDEDMSTYKNRDGSTFGPTKVTLHAFLPASTNAAAVQVKPSAANGHLFLVDPSDKAIIGRNGLIVMAFGDDGATFDGTHKSINYADAGTAGAVVYHLVAGI